MDLLASPAMDLGQEEATEKSLLRNERLVKKEFPPRLMVHISMCRYITPSMPSFRGAAKTMLLWTNIVICFHHCHRYRLVNINVSSSTIRILGEKMPNFTLDFCHTFSTPSILTG
mmetsp:Transcript_15144/g.23245  ORF Transcript_15144/g.23245 Transcript_15144/m.23245 type:complete len:115 (+) Transcript_15144:377-721(+)